MQIIFEFSGTPEDYVGTAAHRETLPPPVCPACSSLECFESLGYYTRGLSKKGSPGVMPIAIRRFRCIRCQISISLLPNFAQPYRLVRNETVQRFFDGDRDANDVRRWDYLLRRYLRRFIRWFPELIIRSSMFPGRAPPGDHSKWCWRIFKDCWGPLSVATQSLVSCFQVTAFGSYRCHAVPNSN